MHLIVLTGIIVLMLGLITLNSQVSPIPLACSEGTVFDVTLQAQIVIGPLTLPVGTVLCLQSSGTNTLIRAIIPNDGVTTLAIVIVGPTINGACTTPAVAAAFTSGVLPSPLSGTTVCVAFAT
jgi:hypothetical protein